MILDFTDIAICLWGMLLVIGLLVGFKQQSIIGKLLVSGSILILMLVLPTKSLLSGDLLYAQYSICEVIGGVLMMIFLDYKKAYGWKD